MMKLKPGQNISKVLNWEDTVNLILEKNNTTNHEVKKWLETKETLGYHFDYFMFAHAWSIQKKINQLDNDHFTVVAGKEGSGKSLLAIQEGATVSQTFSCVHICFSISEFLRAIKDAKRGDTFILDEGAMFLFSRESSSKGNKKIVKLFNIIRQKGLHIMICIPNYANLDSYIRYHRVDTIINIDQPKKSYTAYVGEAIEAVNKHIAKTGKINGVTVPHGTFWRGYWRHKYPEINDFNEKKYREMKSKHYNEYLEEIAKEAAIQENETPTLDENTPRMLTIKQYRQIDPRSPESIIRAIQNGSIPGTKVGGLWMVSGAYADLIMEKAKETGQKPKIEAENEENPGK